MLITSSSNEFIKRIKKLKNKKYRTLYNEFLIEGDHLIEEAIKTGNVKTLILLENTENNFDYDGNIVYVSSNVLKEISSLTTSLESLALCKTYTQSEIIGDKIIMLDDILDPGNLGTIIRSSIAFNIDTIVMSEETVDLYNDKVVRATQGMLFHINIVKMDLSDAIKEVKNKDIKVYGTRFLNATNIKNIDYCKKYAIIVGNEGSGVSDKILNMCDEHIYIGMNEACESLNVSVAASIILYEFNK